MNPSLKAQSVSNGIVLLGPDSPAAQDSRDVERRKENEMNGYCSLLAYCYFVV